MAITDYLKIIQRIDKLIRLQATGTPDEFANKLGIVKSTLYTYINAMKDMNAPIKYDKYKQSFYYEDEGSFVINFMCKELSDNEKFNTFGGGIYKNIFNFFYQFD